MKIIIAMTSAALLGLAASQAAAQAQPGPPTASVSYADLDLGRAGGRSVLEGRVAAAVGRVCPARPLPSELAAQQVYRACHRTAWAAANQQLAAIYGGKMLAEAAIRVGGGGN